MHATVCMTSCDPNHGFKLCFFILTARRYCRPQAQSWPWRKALISWLVHDACLWSGPPWLNLRLSLTHTSLFLHGVLI